MSIFINFLSKIEYHLSIPKLNILKTIYINFRLLPFNEAIKFPIFIYGNTKFHWLTGKIIFKTKPYRGMVKLGKNFDFFMPAGQSAILLQGTLIFHGQCNIAMNSILRVFKGGTLEIGKFSYFGSDTKIFCLNNIKIGSYTQFAYSCKISDSNFHYMYNVDSKLILERDAPILIESLNWFGNNCTINKGTVTKKYTTTGSNSLLNKDFSGVVGDGIVLAGLPAKVISTNVKRIFSNMHESRIGKAYSMNDEKFFYFYETDELESYENHMLKQ